MSRKPTFSIRSLMLLTLFASVVIVFFILATRRTPRPYKPLERFTAGRIALGWTIEVAPDIDGPYRAAGDDWSGAAVYHGSSGGRVKGWGRLRHLKADVQLPRSRGRLVRGRGS